MSRRLEQLKKDLNSGIISTEVDFEMSWLIQKLEEAFRVFNLAEDCITYPTLIAQEAYELRRKDFYKAYAIFLKDLND